MLPDCDLMDILLWLFQSAFTLSFLVFVVCQPFNIALALLVCVCVCVCMYVCAHARARMNYDSAKPLSFWHVGTVPRMWLHFEPLSSQLIPEASLAPGI